MATRLVNIDRDTPMLLPPDLREWVAGDDVAQLVVEAVELCDTRLASLNERGSGDAQYPPTMMLSLLIYSYAKGIFSSRRIERASYEHVSVRFICANTHPDHDTIAKFRRENGALIKACFVRVLMLARELGVLKIGTVSMDGTKLKANASKSKTRRMNELERDIEMLEREVEERLRKAQEADSNAAEAEEDGLGEGLRERRMRLEKLRAAKAELERRALERSAKEDKEKRDRSRGGPPRINPTDPDSGLMPSAQGPFIQGYNAQAVVSAEGDGMILAARVVNATNDRRELGSNLRAVPQSLGTPSLALADSGYDNSAEIEAIEKSGVTTVYCPPQPTAKARSSKEPENKARSSAARQHRVALRARMKKRLAEPAAARIYRKRATTSEPLFNLVKNILGFGRFQLRGLAKVNIEWNLLALAINCRRLAASRAL